MVKDAETFADEDNKVKAQVEARNGLESMAYQLKNQLADKEKLGGKISEEDKATMEGAIEKAIKFLEGNDGASAEELEAAKKELESIVQPIVSKLYGDQKQAPPAGEEGGENKDEL